MKKLSLLIGVLGVMFAINCTRYNNHPEQPGVVEKRSDPLHKIYVENIQPISPVTQSDKVELSVSGNLPSPAYKLNRVDVQVKGSVIEVTPLADYDSSKMAVQVLVPFEEKFTVDDLKPGTYEVKVLGRGETIVAQHKVVVER